MAVPVRCRSHQDPVVEVRVSPVASLAIVIEAPEITAPAGSVTVPIIVPVGVCPSRVTSARNKIESRRFMTRDWEREKPGRC